MTGGELGGRQDDCRKRDCSTDSSWKVRWSLNFGLRWHPSGIHGLTNVGCFQPGAIQLAIHCPGAVDGVLGSGRHARVRDSELHCGHFIPSHSVASAFHGSFLDHPLAVNSCVDPRPLTASSTRILYADPAP